jgi:hypothetical protein
MASREPVAIIRGIGALVLMSVIGLTHAQNAQAEKRKATPIDFTISNKACFNGNGIDTYIQRAIAQRVRAARRGDAGELASFYEAVPSRPWHGLTVTGVGLHYESTSVYFREPVPTVRRILRKDGVRIDANDFIPMASEEAVEVQLLRATTDESRRYGASEVNCGV